MAEQPFDSGLLRAVQADARQEERARILEALEAAEADAARHARISNTVRPHLTGYGRRAAAMREAIDLICAAENGTWSNDAGDPYATVATDCDAVELYEYDPVDEVEPYPVRLVVCDGAESTKASAYLSLDEAEQVASGLYALVERIRTARAGREVTVRVEEGGDG